MSSSGIDYTYHYRSRRCRSKCTAYNTMRVWLIYLLNSVCHRVNQDNGNGRTARCKLRPHRLMTHDSVHQLLCKICFVRYWLWNWYVLPTFKWIASLFAFSLPTWCTTDRQCKQSFINISTRTRLNWLGKSHIFVESSWPFGEIKHGLDSIFWRAKLTNLYQWKWRNWSEYFDTL